MLTELGGRDSNRFGNIINDLHMFSMCRDQRLPGMTKTSNHIISKNKKLLILEFHLIPYLQKMI